MAWSGGVNSLIAMFREVDMDRRKWLGAAYAVALVAPLLVLGPASSAGAEPISPDLATAARTPTSRMAATDASLLGRTDGNAVSVVVKLDYDSTATYRGTVSGFAATSPSVTGKPLSGSATERRYENRIAGLENAFIGQLAARVPGAKVGQRLRTVYGGVALRVPANKVRAVLDIPGVVAVQRDSVHQPQTDSSPAFLGATAVYPQLGGAANAGRGVIFGSLDTGAWPEHPMFADNGNLGAPPPKADGTPRTCNFGDNPTTPASDVFRCNNKLIGGQAFLATYLANNPPPVYQTARDSEGHGTHTASTVAGNPVASVPVLGVDRGPANGVAPGAWVSVYKVCGPVGCYSSDSAAAVQQAIRDGVRVINFSIGGGTSPFAEPAELAFLDAYAAGVFVAVSAGNDGPAASTAGHLSPWVTTVAASTQRRAFEATATVSGSDGASAAFAGASITNGVGPAPLVLSSAAPYSDRFCARPAAAGTLTGRIVACERGGFLGGRSIGRVEKGNNVARGGAVGMILFNPTLADTETDNHFLPTVHLADGGPLLAFVAAHPGLTARFTPGARVDGRADVMAAFSSRGPAGPFLKPDIAAPGVQILAGHTPRPDDVSGGPAGQLYQAIAGTSMAAPHIAGAAVLEFALHPTWTPGQVKSALMTTATTSVVKENLTTPADPFDIGAGRVRIDVAANPGLTFDETASRMRLLAGSPLYARQLNLPSVNVPSVATRSITVPRTARNVTGSAQSYRVEVTAPSGGTITVSATTFTVAAGGTVTLNITVRAGTTGQFFGQVRLVPTSSSLPTLHLPVAFRR
jgi:subtilisin family serine protease